MTSTTRPAFTLGDMVRQLREERGMTQVALARRVGLTGNAFISRLERGAALPSVTMQRRLASALGVEAALLAARAARESHGSTATALLADIGQAFDGARQRFAHELDAMSASLAKHQVRIAHTLRMSELQLLWGLPDKLAYEATVRSAWVFSPELALDDESSALRAVVQANLARGVEYRYLIPRTPAGMKRARALVAGAPVGAKLAVRVLADTAALAVTEVVLYDATTPQRLGLMIAPTDRPDVDCVLSAAHAERFARAFEAAWRKAQGLASGGRRARAWA